MEIKHLGDGIAVGLPQSGRAAYSIEAEDSANAQKILTRNELNIYGWIPHRLPSSHIKSPDTSTLDVPAPETHPRRIPGTLAM